MGRAPASFFGKHFFDGGLQLILCVGLAKEVGAFGQQRFHFVGNGVAGRVEHTQPRPKRDRLEGKIAPAVDQSFQIDVGKQRVDVLRRTQDCQRLVNVASRESV